MNKEFNIEDFIENGEPCNLLEEIQREIVVAELKEIYPKDYLINMGLVSLEEYQSIQSSDSYSKMMKNAQNEAKLMHQVIGFEYF